VVPVYNEQDTLPELQSRLAQLLGRLDGEAEVILVDDGSTDHSWPLIVGLHVADPRFKGLRLSRNFGHQVAITAGMDLAAGDATVVMDADLQDPPEVVLEMAQRWREGYEVVYGVREDRSSDSWFKRSSASLFYSILGRLTDVEIPKNVGDFRLVDRRAVEAFKAMREGDRFVRGMYAWIGFRQIGVPYQRAERHAGSTKYPVKKMLRLAADGMIGFSRLPLKLALKLGTFFAVVALLGGMSVVGLNIFGATVPGWTSLLVAICFLGGLQLAVLGVIGAYLGRTYEETLGRPLYIVSQLRGIGFPIAPPARSVIAEPATVATLLGKTVNVGDRAYTE
jgi:dolichol-phosphate mannosyltransferase